MTSKLTKIRLARGISQRQLEQMTGIHQQTISRIEKGQPLNKLSIAQKLAKALDCEPSDLIDIDAGFNVLKDQNIKNLNNYIKATRELLDLTPRRAANLLNMEEKEYLDCENAVNPLTLDEALTIAAILFQDYARIKLSTEIKVNTAPLDMSANEEKALQELRTLSLEDQEKFINLIKATPLIK